VFEAVGGDLVGHLAIRRRGDRRAHRSFGTAKNLGGQGVDVADAFLGDDAEQPRLRLLVHREQGADVAQRLVGLAQVGFQEGDDVLVLAALAQNARDRDGEPSSQESRASTDGAPPMSVEWKVPPIQAAMRPSRKIGRMVVMSFRCPVPR
jgi:hypothetical protein